MAANPMANRSAALAGAAQALNKPKMPGGDFRQNLAGATGNTIQGAHGGTQQLGMAAQKRLEAAGTAMKPPPAPSIPMPPVKGPNMAGGGLNPDATSMAKPLPGFNPGQMTPPIFAGGQQGPDMPTIDMPGSKPVFNPGAQQGIQGPGGSDQDQMQGGSPQQQMMDKLRSVVGGSGPMGDWHPPGGGPAIGGMPLPGAPGDKPFGPLPGFGGAPGVHAMPGAPDGGILSMPGGPGQISLHGSPMGPGMQTKPMPGGIGDVRPDGQHPIDVWGKIAGGGMGRRTPVQNDPMQGLAPGMGAF